MSTFLMGRKDSGTRLLFGSDTDVSFACYVKLGADTFVEHTYWVDHFDDKFTEDHVKTRVLTRAQLIELFEAQHGSPMQFVCEEDFLKFVDQKH